MTARFPNLPHHMSTLPVDHRGFPVPWFVAWQDGEPLFPVADAHKFGVAHRCDKCWVCGGGLGRFRASVIGPMCALNRTISEPQSHVDCARFSAMNCPFLSRPRMKRVGEQNIPCGVEDAAGLGIKRNPGVACVWIETAKTKPFRAGTGKAGWLFELGEPSQVLWYAHGRPATFAEVMASIDSGLPLLRETIALEPPHRRTSAEAELNARYDRVVDLVRQTALAEVPA